LKMPDPYSIPFKQAEGNGHYASKQLPDDNADFLVVLGLPTSVGNVTSASPSSLDGQLAAYWGTSGSVIKASTLIGVVDLVDGKVTTRLSPTGDIVGTLGVQTLNNKTLTNCTITGGVTGVTKADVGLGNVDNTSDANKPVSGPQQTALNLKEDKSAKGVVNGYAALDATGKVPVGQLPDTVQGTVTFKSYWNATTNTPAIPAASAGNRGWYYVVSVNGTVSVSGITDWAVGDWLVSNGATWDKIDNNDAITSVAGRTGAIVLTKYDVGLGNVDNTSDDTKNSAAAILTNKTINGTNNTLSVRLDNDVVNNLPVARLNNGIGATDQTWWCGDGQWKAPTGAGDMVGPAGAADGEIALFLGATGKLLKRPTGTGIVNVVNGVYQTPLDLAATSKPLIWSSRLRSFNAAGNPNFEIDQRSIGAALTNVATGAWLQDRWKFNKVGTYTVNSTRPAGLIALPGTNFNLSNYCRVITLSAQQASMGAGDYCMFQQVVEGQRLRELVGDVHSLSLLVKSTTAPLKFGVAIRDVNPAVSRSLVKLCTISTADTWTLISLPNLPVFPPAGNWNVTPGIEGYTISVTLACGATFTAPANDTWQNGSFFGAVGQDNFCAKTVNSAFSVAFVQHEPGSECSTFMDCSWQENLSDCSRYYQKSCDYEVAVNTASQTGAVSVMSPAAGFVVCPIAFAGGRMAKNPTITGYSSFNGQINTIHDASAVTNMATTGPICAGQAGFGGFSITPSIVANHLVQFQWYSDTGW
jgi:hypothetical protein